MNYLVLTFMLILACLDTTFGMTREQLKKTLTMTKKQCMPKTGVTEEKVGRIEEGVFYEEKNVMCYVACIYKSIQVMTREQLKKTLTMTKKQCMPKTGVTEEKVGRIEEGVFYEEKNVMCYVACIYKSIQVVKNDKLNKDMVSKQIDILYPPDMKAAAKKSVAKCIDIQDNYNTVCERVFYAAKCFYADNPSNFVFP